MRRFAFSLMALGFLGGLATKALAPNEANIFAVSGLFLLVGSLLLLISGAIRIFRGEVTLRPFDALKRATLIFVIIFGLRQLVWFIFPQLDHDQNIDLIASGAIALALGFYGTAYRKPV